MERWMIRMVPIGPYSHTTEQFFTSILRSVDLCATSALFCMHVVRVGSHGSSLCLWAGFNLTSLDSYPRAVGTALITDQIEPSYTYYPV